MEKLLNKKEIADVLGVSIKAIDKWVSERRIPYIKLSRKCVRFIPTQVRFYLKKLRINVAPATVGKPAAAPARKTPSAQKRVTRPRPKRK